MIWGIIAKFGLDVFNKIKNISPKTIKIILIIVVIGYFVYKYSDNLEELATVKSDNATLEFSLEQKLQTIEQKNKQIENLKKDVIILEQLSKEKQEQVNKINKKNEKFKKELSKIENQCLDSDMPDDVIRLLNSIKED